MKRILCLALVALFALAAYGCSAPVQASSDVGPQEVAATEQPQEVAATEQPQENKPDFKQSNTTKKYSLSASEATYYFEEVSTGDTIYGQCAALINNKLDIKIRIDFVNIDLIAKDGAILFHTEEYDVVPSILCPGDMACVGSWFSIPASVGKGAVDHMEVYFTFHETDCNQSMIDLSDFVINPLDGYTSIKGKATNNTGSDIEWGAYAFILYDDYGKLVSCHSFPISDLRDGEMFEFDEMLFNLDLHGQIIEKMLVAGANLSLPWEDGKKAYSSEVYAVKMLTLEQVGHGNDTDTILYLLENKLTSDDITTRIRYEADANAYIIDLLFPNSGMAETALQLKKGLDQSQEEWQRLVDFALGLCNDTLDFIHEIGDGDEHCGVYVINDVDTNLYLLKVFDGEIIYDLSKE